MGSTVEELSTEGATQDDAQIRAAFEIAVTEDGRPLAQIAPSTGVNYATLSAWRAGKYQGRNDRIASQVQQWLVAREAKKRTENSLPEIPGFVMTPTASRIIEVLERTRVLPDMGVIAGGPGIGKTKALEWYAAQTPNVWVVTMQPCLGEISAMMEVIGATLGSNLRVYRKAERAASIIRMLTGKQGLLIIDEAQHLPPALMDQLRSFHDIADVGIAMAGNETVFSRFGADRRTPQFAQLFSRVGQRFARKELTKGDLDVLIGAWGLTDDGAAKAARAIGRRPGAARGMTKALRMAFVLARAEGRDQPNQADVEMAWQQLSGEQA